MNAEDFRELENSNLTVGDLVKRFGDSEGVKVE